MILVAANGEIHSEKIAGGDRLDKYQSRAQFPQKFRSLNLTANCRMGVIRQRRDQVSVITYRNFSDDDGISQGLSDGDEVWVYGRKALGKVEKENSDYYGRRDRIAIEPKKILGEKRKFYWADTGDVIILNKNCD